ncbi:hypothetical protein ACHAWO_006481 [Cyclotella atomus]|uniref:Uncharacterized protein n=1 Tax=Cyclotella atomus TaxID=382360 RepID=A0ABD3Q2I2_9STRA
MASTHSTNAGFDCQLISDVCSAIEKGDDVQLASRLDIQVVNRGNSSDATVTDQFPPDTAEDEIDQSLHSNDTKIDALLHCFYHLIEHQGVDDRSCDDVKTHLVLKALLRLPLLDSNLYKISWQAVAAAIMSLQYAKSKTSNKQKVSHSEDLKLVAEIRSYLSNILSTIHTINVAKRKQEYITLSSEQLLLLGRTIIAPLLRSHCDALKEEVPLSSTDVRRQSYLLPLQLIPIILSVADAFDDANIDVSQSLVCEKFARGMGVEQIKEDSESMDDQKSKVTEPKSEDEEPSTSVSDRLLALLFSSHTHEETTQIFIRADSVLPILALAIDDIGSVYMSSVRGTAENADSYWACLRLALDNVIVSSIKSCFKRNASENDRSGKQHDSSRGDEGMSIIPHTDYPALIRCIIRMITANNTGTSIDQSATPCWESLLHRTYHAAIVAALTPTSMKHKAIDRMSILSTIESHVLLPAFTSAAVPSIRSILYASSIQCCPLCRLGDCDSKATNDIAVPSFAVARLVLLIMRARASTISSFSTHRSTGLCPRAIFQMTSEILRRETDIPDCQNESNESSDDEFQMALKVLLNLSVAESGACPKCSDSPSNGGSEAIAYEVMNHSYYRCDGKFITRSTNQTDAERIYIEELGLDTLQSYANLVISSLTHGAIQSTDKSHYVDAFIADAAQAWLDAAIMLFDDGTNRSGLGNSMSSDSNAFASVILVVVFFEVPSSQHDIIQRLYNRLLSSTSRDFRDDPALRVLSILAWSMASGDVGMSSSTVFSRRDDKLRCDMSVFGPICSLLSKPIVSGRDYGSFFAASETSPLSYGAAIQLARSLISVPSARDSILAMAKKHMRAFAVARHDDESAALSNLFSEHIFCTQAANNDAMYFAAACLCLLVEKHQESQTLSLDDCGCEALTMVTDMIALRRPSSSSAPVLPPGSVTSWMISELNDAATHGMISNWTCHRLVRACLYALLQCCTVSCGLDSQLPEATFSLGTPPQVDIVGLLRLALSLCDLLGDNRPPISSAHILSVLVKNNQVAPPSMLEGFGMIWKGFPSCEEPNDALLVDRSLLAVFLDGAAMILHHNFSLEWSHTSSPHFQKIERYLQQSEHIHYAQMASDNQHGPFPFPDWLKGETNPPDQDLESLQTFQSKESANSSGSIKKIVHSLCDLFVDILAGEAFVGSEGSSKMNLTESDLIDCINFLRERRHYSSADTDKPLSSVKLSSLLHLFSRHLQNLVNDSPKTKQALIDSEMTIKHALGYCEQLVSSGKARAEKPFSESQYSAIWTFYVSIADEVSTRALISLALDVYKETGWAPFSPEDESLVASGNEFTFSLTTVSSDEVLDDQIHHIRNSSLSALSHVLSLGPQIMLASDRKSSLLSLLTQSLLKLCMDMSDGFQGHSGGMRKSLFLQYVSAIDGCVNSITIIVDTMSERILCECIPKFLAVNEAIVIVWNAFCEYSFEESFLVKAVLQLCVDKLPSLLRRVEMTTGQGIDSNSNLMPSVNLLEHASARLRATMSHSASLLNNVDETRHELYPINRLIEPEFASLNVAKWACNIAFASMSSFWHESNKVSIAAQSNILSSNTPSSRAIGIAYGKLRIGCFKSLHFSISRFFEVTEAQRSSISKGEDEVGASQIHINTTFAVNLSYRGKSYLCSCLDKTTTNMLLCLKALIGYLNKPSGRQSKSLLESIASVIGYFSSLVYQSSTAYDAITAPTLWFASECDAVNGTVNHSVLHRLQKIIHRTASIGIELQNLRMIVSGAKHENASQMNALNALAFANLPKANAEMAFCELIDMGSNIVQSRLKSLRSFNPYAGLFLDGDDDASGNEDQVHASKKRRLDLAPSRSRRMSLRSRNETIDDWLSLDNKDLASGERFSADDAFVDLEDFIVEG